MKTKFQFLTLAVLVSTALVSCGGGGGGGGSGSTLYYPYETLYGDICSTQEATPGCTFLRSTGARINVTDDPHYNYYGHGSDDMYFVQFDSSGQTATVYDNLGFVYDVMDISEFSHYVSGYYIGLGITGLFWEDVRNGTYWWGKNGVLYSANTYDSNYGKAINDKSAGEAADTNLAALSSEANESIVKAAEDKLVSEFGLPRDKASVVASNLNRWGVAAAERGYTSVADMDKTFKSTFGVDFGSALAAVKDLQNGDVGKMRDLTNRSANALGIKPSQAQKFIKGMYKKALASYGYDADAINW